MTTERSPLTVDALGRDPLAAFARWLDEAAESGVGLAETTVLATATPEAHPSARAVLVRRIDESGVGFFSSYRSRKGRELAANPHGALCSVWPTIERQVRIEGPVRRLSAEDSDVYWRSRPRRSQLSAWASRQSEPVADRAILEQRVGEVESEYPGRVPRPDWWGGYHLEAQTMEFWQGREHRLHDRLRFDRTADGWQVQRLAP